MKYIFFTFMFIFIAVSLYVMTWIAIYIEEIDMGIKLCDSKGGLVQMKVSGFLRNEFICIDGTTFDVPIASMENGRTL